MEHDSSKKINNKKKRLATFTLGCKVNQYETAAIEKIFIKGGYDIVPFESEADIYLINTCTVTSIADRKSRQMIRRAKSKNPDAKVIVTGCYSQENPELILKMDEVNLVMGTTDKGEIFSQAEKLKNTDKINLTRDVFEEKEFEDIDKAGLNIDHTRAFIKVQDGCDRYCSYCIIPYTRGRVRSKKPESVISEVTALAENGFKEIVLTGIHLSSYGKDLKTVKLIDLIERLDKINGIERIRLGSLEPRLIDDEFLARAAKAKKFCPNFHLSLQSGSGSVLKRMNRKYTPEQFRIAVCKIRQTWEDPIITTDVIVGFPGETDEEFLETYEFLKEIKFYYTHIFKYSRRKGTPAYDMPAQISPDIKHARSTELIKLCDQNKSEFEKNLTGKELRVLFEERNGDYISGHSFNFVKVSCKTEEDLTGKILKIKITGADEKIGVYGEIE